MFVYIFMVFWQNKNENENVISIWLLSMSVDSIPTEASKTIFKLMRILTLILIRNIDWTVSLRLKLLLSP